MTKQEHNHKYYLKHREEIIKKVQEYATQNPEVNKKATAKWREKNRESEKERSKRSYLLREKQVKEYFKSYRQTEKGKMLHQLYELKRRAIRIDGSSNFDFHQWIKMKSKVGNKCLACGESEPKIKLSIDHVIPFSKGGKHIMANIQPLCISCNIRKHTAIIDYRRGQIL